MLANVKSFRARPVFFLNAFSAIKRQSNVTHKTAHSADVKHNSTSTAVLYTADIFMSPRPQHTALKTAKPDKSTFTATAKYHGYLSNVLCPTCPNPPKTAQRDG